MLVSARNDIPWTPSSAEIIYSVWAWRTSLSVVYAAFTALVWDMLLTMADEVRALNRLCLLLGADRAHILRLHSSGLHG